MADDITGRVYHHLTVIRKKTSHIMHDSDGRPHVSHWWLCRCDCGGTDVIMQSLLTGHYVRKCKACCAKEGKTQKMAKDIKKYGQSDMNARKKRVSVFNVASMDRGQLPVFIKYFAMNKLLFFDTFNRPFSPEVATEEFRKLK